MNFREVPRRSVVRALVALAMSLPVVAWSDCPKSPNDFLVYAADINGDGLSDYAIVPRKNVIVVPMDDDIIVVPIQRSLEGFEYTSQAGGLRVLTSLPGGELPSGAWQPVMQAPVLIDRTASGCNSLVLRGLTSGSGLAVSSVLVVDFLANGKPSALQLIDSPVTGSELSAGDLRAEDISGDGRQDLVHLINGLIQDVYVSSSTGTLTADDDSTVMAVWRDFLQASLARDPRAQMYFAVDVLQRYEGALTADVLQNALTGIKAAGIASSNANLAFLTIQRGSTDGDVLYTVAMSKMADGAWRITGF